MKSEQKESVAFELRMIAESLRHFGEQGAPPATVETMNALDKIADRIDRVAKRL